MMGTGGVALTGAASPADHDGFLTQPLDASSYQSIVGFIGCS